MEATRKTVRVFISSTFRDMHSERDHLVTVVFPELRERLERLDLDFYDVDLRWGVPHTGVDGERINSWAYCKQWIDRVEPFFVCIVGERYGWTPPSAEIHDVEDRANYAGLSITEMEIRHAALRGQRRHHSYFFFRKPQIPKDTPAAILREYADLHDQERLRELKRQIQSTGRPVRFYDCRWTGQSFKELEAFGQLVLEDLWSGVLRDSRYVPREIWHQVLGHNPDDDPIYTNEHVPVPVEVWDSILQHVKPTMRLHFDAENRQMTEFAVSRLRWFQGRDAELRQLTSFVDTDLPSTASRLCVVGAVAGQGKSALLARFAVQLADSPHLLISHFVGATERSADIRSLLERLNQELEHSGIEWPADTNPLHDTDGLARRLAQRLGNYSGTRRIILMIDAINQLTDGHDLTWLPVSVARSVRIIVSTIDDGSLSDDNSEGRIAAALHARKPQPKRIALQALDSTDVRQIVVDYLHEYCKELDREQINSICRMHKARNPLYLLTMLHELRTLGGNDMHQFVPRLIEEIPIKYPNSIRLFDWVLERLEYFGSEAVRLWCSYLFLGRVGMSSRELGDLVAAKLGAEGGPNALRIERGIRRYLQHRGSQLDFFHGQLREAVALRYLAGDVTPLHRDIAEYFKSRWREPYRHALSELPHHQIQGRGWNSLLSTLGDQQFIDEKESALLGDSLHQDFRLGIENAVAVGRPFVAASLALRKGRLVLDSTIRNKPGQLGLVVHLISKAGDRPLLNRIVSAVLQSSDATIRTGACLEVLLAGGQVLLPEQRDHVLTAVRQGLAAAASLPQSPNVAVIRDTNVIHGRAYEFFFVLAYIRDAEALADALRTYMQLPKVWSITDYALHSQLETSTVRRNHIESIFEVANEFSVVAQVLGPLLGDIEALTLLDAGQFTSVVDLFTKVNAKIQPDLFFQVVLRCGRRDLLLAWRAQLDGESAPSFIKPQTVRMMIELELGNRGAAIQAYQDVKPSIVQEDQLFEVLAEQLRALAIWQRLADREMLQHILREIKPQIDQVEPVKRLQLLVEWISYASHCDWPTDEIRDIWYRAVGLWEECRDESPWCGDFRICHYFKFIRPRNAIGPEGLLTIDDWVRTIWRVTDPSDLKIGMAVAEYARRDPPMLDLLADVTNRFSIVTRDILTQISTDKVLEWTLFYGEAILYSAALHEVPGVDKEWSKLVSLLRMVRDETRFGERSRSLLCNLVKYSRPMAGAMARQMVSYDYRPPLTVLDVITQSVAAFVLTDSQNVDKQSADRILAAARYRKKTLAADEYRAFGALIMASRTRYYSADLINRESCFNMVGGRGAHIDAFDVVPEEEGKWILSLLSAEALAAHGQTDLAKRELMSSMRVAMVRTLPQNGEMSRNSDSQALSLAIWFWTICGPLAKRLGMELPVRGEFPLAVPEELTERSGFEEIYRYLGMCDRWADKISPGLLSTIILRAADESNLRCRFLLLFMLRGLAFGKRIAEFNQDEIDQSALHELLDCPTNAAAPEPTSAINESDFLARNYCHLCGHKISDTPSTAPCPNCGSRLFYRDETQMDCRKCGTLVPGDARYCAQCGAEQYDSAL